MRFQGLYEKWRQKHLKPSGDQGGFKINLTIRLYPNGTKTDPRTAFVVAADNTEGQPFASAGDLAQLLGGFVWNLEEFRAERKSA